MSNLFTWSKRAAIFSILLVPQLALAGDPSGTGSVLIRPLSSSSIPSLGSYGLIALGLLLAVVAIRVIRAHEGTGNLLGIAILATGVAAGGIGAERAWASGVINISGDVCNQGGWIDYNAFIYLELTNYCRNDVQIVEITANCPLNSDSDNCEEGDILTAYTGSNPDSCPLPQCDN